MRPQGLSRSDAISDFPVVFAVLSYWHAGCVRPLANCNPNRFANQSVNTMNAFKSLPTVLQSIVQLIHGRRRIALQPVRVALLAAMSLVAARAVVAQESMSEGPPGGYYHVDRPFNVENGFWQDHSSTAAEGYLRGLSAYIQSLGVYEVNNAQANILNEQAEWAGYENALKRVETFYDRRKIRQDYLTQQREIADIRDQEGKQILEQKRATVYRRAYKLSLQEFNAATGQLFWPETLCIDLFAAHRHHLDQLFAHRSQYQLHHDEYLIHQIEKVHQELKRDLRQHRAFFNSQDYLAAQDFLRGLIYEAKYPTVTG